MCFTTRTAHDDDTATASAGSAVDDDQAQLLTCPSLIGSMPGTTSGRPKVRLGGVFSLLSERSVFGLCWEESGAPILEG